MPVASAGTEELDVQVYIHAGFHKTASTSFQKYCRYYDEVLFNNNIYYPNLNGDYQHSALMNEHQVGRFDSLANIVKDAKSKLSPNGILLLSGEDFETCFGQLDLTKSIEDTILRNGADNIKWFCVTRNPVDYIISLYSTLSKESGVVMDIDVMREAALQRGALQVSTKRLDYTFIFDPSRFLDAFREATVGEVILYHFEDFIKPFPGAEFLGGMMDQGLIEHLWKTLPEFIARQTNPRLSGFKVECNYIATSLGLGQIMKDRRRRRLATPLLAPLAFLRLSRSRKLKNELEEYFVDCAYYRQQMGSC